MNHVWTVPWRSSCTSLRCVQSTLLDVPKALIGSRLGREIPRSRGQIIRQYTVPRQPLQQQARYLSGEKPLWAKSSTTSVIEQSWSRARHKSSGVSLPKRRVRSGPSTTKTPGASPPPGRLPTHPEDLDPQEGVRFRTEDLSEKEITSIFGPYIDKEEGNRILRLLHGQRVSGTLDQGLSVPRATAYVQSLIATGLIWLRAHYPVDEDAAIRTRVEKEQEEEEKELLEDASKLGILPQGSTDKSRFYGVSGLDAIREHYESQPVPEVKSMAEKTGVEMGKLQPVDGKKELCMYPFVHNRCKLDAKNREIADF